MLHLSTFFILLALVSSEDVGPRIDCHPEPNASQEECEKRRCRWVEGDVSKNEPWCIYGLNTGYLLVDSLPQDINNFTLKRNPMAKNPYYPNLEYLQVKSQKFTSYLRIQITDPNNDRQWVHTRKEFSIIVPQSPDTFELIVDESAPGQTFAFSVVARRATGNVKIWDTSIGGLLYGDQYIQIATHLPTKNIYGFGEHIHKKIKHNMNRYTTWPMFTSNHEPDSVSELSTSNLNGVHPFYMGIEDTGDAHGVLILNSNAQEVTLGTGPHLVYRTIGGILDLYFFIGPKPEDVIKQYQSFIGAPLLPSFWAFGFQLYLSGYSNTADIEIEVNKARNAGVPLDVVIIEIGNAFGIDYSTSGWKGLKEYADRLHSEGLHLTLMINPAVSLNSDSFRRAQQTGISFFKWPDMSLADKTMWDKYPSIRDTAIMVGNQWPTEDTVLPDYVTKIDYLSDYYTWEWYTTEFQKLINLTGMDSISLDRNEPYNFDTGPRSLSSSTEVTDHLSCPVSGNASKYDNPKYPTHAVWDHGNDTWLFSKTLCMIGEGNKHNLYDAHSWLALALAMESYHAQVATKSRGAAISTSSFSSIGQHVGHCLSDNGASWENLQTSVIRVQEFNMFGISYVGSDICGPNGIATEELCVRWHQTGAFYTYARNHIAKNQVSHLPAQWKSVANAAKISLLFKYTYLLYLYTLAHDAYSYGGTIIRPLFFEFPDEPATYDIDYQFMWGNAMMFVPAVFPGRQIVTGYVPKAEWFSLRESDYGAKISSVGMTANFSARYDEVIPVFARGFSIIPKQKPATVIRDMHNNPISFLVVLDSASWTANGKLFWDGDDLSIYNNIDYCYMNTKFYHYEYSGNVLAALSFSHRAKPQSAVLLPPLESIEVMNYPCTSNPAEVTVVYEKGDEIVSLGSVTLSSNKVLTMRFDKPLNLTGVNEIVWLLW